MRNRRPRSVREGLNLPTVVAPVVNMASRIQNVARMGEVLVSEEVYRQVDRLFPAAEAREATLKGIEKPVKTYVLAA